MIYERIVGAGVGVTIYQPNVIVKNHILRHVVPLAGGFIPIAGDQTDIPESGKCQTFYRKDVPKFDIKIISML